MKQRFAEKILREVLVKGKGKAAFVKNLKTELAAGKPKKQALAIAYATQRRAGGKPKPPKK
jgi:hypothetical protein